MREMPVDTLRRGSVLVAFVDVAVNLEASTWSATTIVEEAYTTSLNHTGMVVEAVRVSVL